MRTSRGEQPALIPLPGAADSESGSLLEAVLHPGEGSSSGAVIAPPHPQYGGNMDNPVVSEIADACQRVGLASLRFNWRGIGTSSGVSTGSAELAVADYSAALTFALGSCTGSIVACGYSFGAASAVSAVAGRERVKALLLVAPPIVMLDRAALQSFPGHVLLIAGDRDEFAPLDQLEALVQELDNAEFVALAGTDHYFTSGLSELGRAAESFLQCVGLG